MFGLFQKKSPKKRVIRNRARYNIVDGNAQRQIAPSNVEFQSEDEILNSSRRGKLLNLTRNLVRNSSIFSTILLQLDVNVVGTQGGKVILNFRDNEINKNLTKYFSDYTRNVDFFDGHNLNELLKIWLKSQIIGGDLVLVFDHDIEGSGKIIWFESDEIINCDSSIIEKHYGKGCIQSLGKVYSPSGRWIGTTVSRSQRGIDIVKDESKVWFLKRDPNGNPLDEFWIQPTNTWRKSTRGISQAATSVNAATQLNDLILSELEASRKNAQTFCFLQSEAEDEEEIPSAFDDDVDFDGMTDAEIEAVAKGENEECQNFSLQAAHENSVAFQQLPAGYKAALVDTKHPNTNCIDFTQYLAGLVGSVLGFSRAYVMGNPSNEDFRAQQLLTAPAIQEYQHNLEKICDWIFYNHVKFLKKNGIIDFELPDDYMRYVSWDWKRLDSCDEVQTENANSMKLRNLTGSYRDLIGNDWKDKLLQIAEEQKWMKDNGLTHPSALMVSGGQTEISKGE